MTNWRELGFVPDSDDEDYGATLSSQSDHDGEEFVNEIRGLLKAGERENKVAVASSVTGSTISRFGSLAKDSITGGNTSEGYIDIDQIFGELPRTGDSTIAKCAHTFRASSQHGDSKTKVNGVNTGEESKTKEVATVDISNQPEIFEDQEDRVQLIATNGERIHSLDAPGIVHEEGILSQDIETQLGTPRERTDWAANVKAVSENHDGGNHPMSFERTLDISIPAGQDFEQPGLKADSSSVVSSSPLSSVSSTAAVTPEPPSMSHGLTNSVTFQVVVPRVNNEQRQWGTPVRIFRKRKPIQKNPYLIEGERYRQTLQSRGVKPLRIQEAREEPGSTQGAHKDSQESEYVVPSEPSHQSKRAMDEELYDEEREDPFSSAASAIGDVEPSDPLPVESKRRKVAHTYSEEGSVPKSDRITGKSTQRKQNARPFAGAEVDGVARDADIYDMPIDSSPYSYRSSRNYLEYKSPNYYNQGMNERTTNLTKPKEKLHGLFAGIDSESESGSDHGQSSSQPNRLTREVSHINPLSSPLHSNSETKSADDSENENQDEEDQSDEDQSEEDESQLIRKFQRKTTGVLPASWWKLNQGQQTGRSSIRRNARSAVSPISDEISRPGVARAKISSRPRPPDTEVSSVDRSGSEVSSDEPVIIDVAPTKRHTGENSTPKNHWISFDDVVEDDRIDRMLPKVPRRSTMQTKRGKQKINGGISYKNSEMSHSKENNSTSKKWGGSTRFRQPKITDHVSSKSGKPTRPKRPQVPKIGILDAAQHYRATSSAPVPLFIKIAERGAKKRRDQGRQSPSRKTFFLETETHTKDIQSVLREWREGTLDIVPQAGRFRPARPEIEKPMNNTLRRLHQPPRRAVTPNLTQLLHNSVQRKSHFTNFAENNCLFRPTSDETPIIHPTPAAHPPLKTAIPTELVPRVRVRRKRMPKRVDVDTIEHRQPPLEDINIDDIDDYAVDEIPITSKPTLHGLLKYGNKYSLNFDTMPMKPGTFFGRNTFIGDGGLFRALNTIPVTEGRNNQSINFKFGDKMLHWGLYQDSISAELETIMNLIADSAERSQRADDLGEAETSPLAEQVYSFLQFFSTYLASYIDFSDSIDVISFGQRTLQSLDGCCVRLLASFGGSTYSNSKMASTRLKVQLLVFGLVFKFQICRLTSTVNRTRLDISKSIQKMGQILLGQLLKCGLDDVRVCYEDQRHRGNYETGISSKYYLIEAWVISIQILDQIKDLGVDIGFWKLFNVESRISEIQKSLNIQPFEKIWRIIFTVLPLYQFDQRGSVQQQPNDIYPPENWSSIKALVTRPLEIYFENPEGHSSTVINYCRILYSRCYHLINSWGWENPDIIIPTLYQFFADSHLINLKDEAGYESVEFLQNLEKSPSITIQNYDRCFHLLLKTIVLGINTMKTTSKSVPSTKRIRNMVNRLVPNHRRKHPKEEELQIKHLNALRNHHDLLATLYWAAPPGCRPPLDAIINLVDPETCHLQACEVSIQTWSNLLRFKLHSGEGIEGLEPFVEWFDEIVGQILGQHNAARSEAEKIFKAANEGGNDISEDSLELNIRRNQKKLEDVLVKAFKCLHTALAGIDDNLEGAAKILSKASISNVFNSNKRLSHRPIIEVLRVVKQYVYTCRKKDSTLPSILQVGEDSQDYGDWSDFGDLAAQDAEKDAGKHLSGIIYDSLRQMLSNYFGADRQPEETLLVEIVDSWVLVIEFLVQTGFKEWDVYLNTYNHESWGYLRDTEQTRKFTAYFMTKVIQARPDTYELNKETFISFWFKTLVERKSILKFQNVYTATLLNCDPWNPIFENLPFERDEPSGQFRISQDDFRSRRLSLISSVLANMRKSYETARGVSPTNGESLKQEYSRMLRSMMKSMKDNYQELQTNETSDDYVKFVQTIVEYLQQHTVDLVSVDTYFVNPEFFPLPATDPTYVVGKLKNYGLKLHNQRGQDQLTSFIQAVFERAAIDGEQKYLVDQLTTALSGGFEEGDQDKPTLRAFFIGFIFPAYLECTFCEPCGWILAMPVLAALEKVVIMMPEDIDSTFYPCVKSVLSMLASLLEGMRIGVRSLNPSEALLPSVLDSLMIMFNALTRIIPLIDWLSTPEISNDINDLSEVAYDCACFLIRYSGYIKDIVENREPQIPIDVRGNQRFQGRYKNAYYKFIDQLKKSFSKEWYNHDGSWFVARGAKRSEIVPPNINGREESRGMELRKREYVRTVKNLLKVACRTEMFEEVGLTVDPDIWLYEGRGVPHSDRVRGRRHARALRALGDLFF